LITDHEMRDHLTRFLSGYGAATEDLLGEVDGGFGEPELTVASGSVLHGFGNAGSDIDLHIVVAGRKVTNFPVSSHRLGVAVDTTFFDAEWVRAESSVVLAGPGSPAGVDRAAWRAARARLLGLGRLSFGYALAGSDDWRAWQAGLREPFVGHAVAWWRAETLRYRTAARLLAHHRPLAAALRSCDAATAALDALASAGGQVYVGHKWLGLKLERLGRADLVEAYARLLDLPVTVSEVPAYQAAAEELIHRLTADDPLPDDPFVTLTPADGTTSWQVQDRVLVHRWGLRGVELTSRDAGADPKLAWTGRVSELPNDLQALIEEDLVWISVSENRL
jgi:hypothetical protein